MPTDIIFRRCETCDLRHDPDVNCNIRCEHCGLSRVDVDQPYPTFGPVGPDLICCETYIAEVVNA
jgi:hypothetical protein